jgi:E3 ubiquitin-protein ligase HECTD2
MASQNQPANYQKDLRLVDTSRDMDFPSRDGFQGPSRVTEVDMLQHAYGIPSLQKPCSQVSNHGSGHGHSTPRHGRSMSHPFPSIFQGRRRRKGDNSTAAFDSADPDPPHPTPPSPLRAALNKSARGPDKELVTGKCMACDSMVRWPKEITVFRCTVCLTIHDLNPPIALVAPGSLDRANAYAGENLSTGTADFPKSWYYTSKPWPFT